MAHTSKWMLVALLGLTPVAVLSSVTTPVAHAADPLPSAEELLSSIDRNLTFTTRTATVKMIVVSPQRTREFVMRTYGRGEDEAAIEYLEPSRDKGTKMLRRGEEMWMWLPSVESVQKISGHMLRQGMMGSDLSYEDMMGFTTFREAYSAKVVGSETVGGIDCWKIEMNAKDASIAYPRRVAWLDKKSKIPVRQELFAVSGMLLKVWEMGNIQPFDGGRLFPTRMVIIDKLKQGTSTTIELTSMTFGVALEEETFSQRWLERH